MTKSTKPKKVISEFFAEIGRRNGTKLREERGSEYFREIRKKRKTYPKLKKEEEQPKEPVETKNDSSES